MYEVTCKVLNVRTGAGSTYQLKKYNALTDNAKEQIKAISNSKANGYVRGMKFLAVQVKNSKNEAWALAPSGWVCIENKSGTYCKKI